MHNSIRLQNIGFVLSHKICFEGFSVVIHNGDRIAIIGRNGNGKTMLLRIIQGLAEPTAGTIHIPKDVIFGYVPQNPGLDPFVEGFETLSGGQRFNKALTQALAKKPNVLCLDEPTNHMDQNNRRSLFRMLRAYQGTLIIVSHDVELLRTCVDTIWHIDNGAVHVFSGSYDDYLVQRDKSLQAQLGKVERLKKERKQAREAFQFEEQRAVRSGKMNRDDRDKMQRNTKKNWGDRSSGKKRGIINEAQSRVNQALNEVFIPKEIKATFTLDTKQFITNGEIVSIVDGTCGYIEPLLQGIYFSLRATERVAIQGDNGSGKSTFVKAILDAPEIKKTGLWRLPKVGDSGYLDQHYTTLPLTMSAFDSIKNIRPEWSDNDIRKHLNTFLFRKNEETLTPVKTFSGGEKARLSLAVIAAQSPRLLILDEVTNNIDLETREYMIQVLNAYPGALIVISHDEDFLRQIGISTFYQVDKGRLNVSVFNKF